MKIDEDLIFEPYEKIRDNLYEYFELAFCQEERDMHLKPLVKIVMPWSEFISKVKYEQEIRDEEREEFLRKLDENGLSEEEYGQSYNDYFDTMKSAM